MVGFADSFWSAEYAPGLDRLFGKLQQGVVENRQILTIARLRAEAEEAYGDKLKLIPAASEKPNGFAKDDGASIKKAYEGIKKEMDEAGNSHRKVAENIRKLVIDPFSQWCDAHESRIEMSNEDLQTRIKNYEKQSETVKKLRGTYFNKCLLLEDYEEENKYAFQTPEKTTDSPAKGGDAPQIKLPDSAEEEDSFEIGDMFYPPSQLRQILEKALEEIPMKEVKVTLLGTYPSCTPGDVLVQYIQKNIGATTVSAAERIGQDLVGHGFLRLVGNMGSTFANSSKMNYQWRPKAFDMAGKTLQRKSTILQEEDPLSPETPGGSAITELFSKYIAAPRPGESQAQRMKREATEADERYRNGVTKLDLIRCNLEEAMMDHLKFMERCETDRLRAIKAVILDFSGAISNVIPTLQSTVDTMMLFQETVQPAQDLRYLIDSYRTGTFIPRVTTYESYYKSPGDQTYGVDLELRARGDRKRVPLIVTSILTYLDNHYPDLETDEARRGIWTIDVNLKDIHKLRNAINNGKAIPREVLEAYDMPIVASALKLYLLELPDSLVFSRFYDVIKTIYHTHGGDEENKTRVSIIQNTIGGLLLVNIATLDAIVSHFTRLIELTSADEKYTNDLSTTFAPCILRPRVESMVTQHDKHPQRLFKDLLANKEAIFGELKRERSLNAGRNRAVSSTDESSRKINQQARAQAVIARSRPNSPVAQTRVRRDSSRGGDFPRLPINPTSPPGNHSGTQAGQRFRSSLEVPGGLGNLVTSTTSTTTTSSQPSSANVTTSNNNTTSNNSAVASATSGPLPDIDASHFVNEASSQFSQTAENINHEEAPSPTSHHQEQQTLHQPPPQEPKQGLGRNRALPSQRRSIRSSQIGEDNFYNANSVPDGRVGVSLTDRAFDDD